MIRLKSNQFLLHICEVDSIGQEWNHSFIFPPSSSSFLFFSNFSFILTAFTCKHLKIRILGVKVNRTRIRCTHTHKLPSGFDAQQRGDCRSGREFVGVFLFRSANIVRISLYKGFPLETTSTFDAIFLIPVGFFYVALEK